MAQAVKGEDYIIDYYLLLGVEHDASVEEIRKARNEMVRKYHPDRVAGMGAELVGIANRRTELANEASSVLLAGPEAKAQYDKQLDEWEDAISVDGVPIIDASKPGFSMRSLTEYVHRSDELLAHADQEMEGMVRMMSGYNHASFTMFMDMAASEDGVPDDLREAFGEQLANRDCYLSLLESFAWDSIGERNKLDDKPSLAHAASVDSVIESVSEQAKEGVEEQVLMLTVGEMSLLPPPEGGIDAAGGTDVVLRNYQEQFDTYIEKRATRIREFAKERQALLHIRFTITGNPRYHELCVTPQPKLALGLVHPKQTLWFCLDIDGTIIVAREEDDPWSIKVQQMEDPGVAEEFIAEGFSILRVDFLTDVDVHSQMVALASRHQVYVEKGSFDVDIESLDSLVLQTDYTITGGD